jgi:hypothetical protein
MKSRNILYIIAGVFNCIVGSLAILFGLFILLLGKIIRQMFESSMDLVHGITKALAEEDPAKYGDLTSLTDTEAVAYVMKFVYIICAISIIIGAIWITLGIINILLKNRHDKVFSSKKYLRHIFVVACWLLMGLNVANILTTIAVYKKIDTKNTQKLYSVKNN